MPASATSLVTCELVLVASCFRFVLSHAAHFLSSQTATESDALACGDQMLQKHLRTHASASSLMSGRGKGPKAAQSLAQHSSRVTAGEGHCIRSHCAALSPASQVKVLSLHPFSFFCVCESPLTPLTHSLTHSLTLSPCMHALSPLARVSASTLMVDISRSPHRPFATQARRRCSTMREGSSTQQKDSCSWDSLLRWERSAIAGFQNSRTHMNCTSLGSMLQSVSSHKSVLCIGP
jgi:hypothetical protein